MSTARQFTFTATGSRRHTIQIIEGQQHTERAQSQKQRPEQPEDERNQKIKGPHPQMKLPCGLFKTGRRYAYPAFFLAGCGTGSYHEAYMPIQTYG